MHDTGSKEGFFPPPLAITNPVSDVVFELSFGPYEPVKSIPALSEWELIAITLLIGTAGLIAVKRRRNSA